MDRRYYGLKALVIGVAVSAAILGGGLECSRLTLSRDPNYQAAFVAQSAIHEAGLRLRHTLGRLFAQTFADL